MFEPLSKQEAAGRHCTTTTNERSGLVAYDGVRFVFCERRNVLSNFRSKGILFYRWVYVRVHC